MSEKYALVPVEWRAFIEDCANTAGGMVNGNRLSSRAAGLLAAAPAPVVEPVQQAEQKPVHWRAVLAADQRQQQLHDKHVVGFTTKEAAEAWVAAKKDSRGWEYLIEPLYTTPQPTQDVSGLVEALEKYADDSNWCYDTCNIGRDAAKAALAAHRAKQETEQAKSGDNHDQ